MVMFLKHFNENCQLFLILVEKKKIVKVKDNI